MSLLRRKLSIRSVHGGGRLYSTPSVALNDEIMATFESSAATFSTVQNTKLKSLATKLPSRSFLDLAFTNCNYMADANLGDKNQLIRWEIFNLIDIKHYQGLLDAMVKFSTLDNLPSLLSHDEISRIMRILVDHQLNLLSKFATSCNYIDHTSGADKTNSANFKLSRHFLFHIRLIYSNLLYKNSPGHLYLKSRTQQNNGAGDTASMSTFTVDYNMTVQDFENLILMECRNGKLDLASTWFRNFELYFKQEYLDKMTQNLWILKFQTLCGGLPHLWPSYNSKLYKSVSHSKRQSYLVSEVSFINVFNEFLKHNTATNKSSNLDLKLLMNNRFNETLIYSIGYSGNMDYLKKYIASMWGINEEGLVKGFTLPKEKEMNYPDYKILKSILISFSRNDHFFEAMKYINHFHDIYNIDVSSTHSKSFWEQVFLWCDLTTKFDEALVLSYYLRETGVKVKSKKSRAKSAPTLTEAQQNVNFDYEGFLNYVKELRTRRSTMFDQLLQLYLESGSKLSLVVANKYFKYLVEPMEDNSEINEERYYEFLTVLLKEYNKYDIASDSFNRRSDIGSKIGNIDEDIRSFYQTVLKKFIDYKWSTTFAGQCQPLIRKWLIDNAMKKELSEWFIEVRLPQYEEMMKRKRQDFMISLRTEDDKESLLDLI